MIFKVMQLTCGDCGERHRVRARLTSNTEVQPRCPGCGAVNWLNLPTEHPSLRANAYIERGLSELEAWVHER